MATDDHDEGLIRLETAVSADRDHFFRRTCASCGRDFKTEIDQADLSYILNSQIRRSGIEIGATADGDVKNTTGYLYCPYCKYRGETSEMITEELRQYFKRITFREVVSPMMTSFLDRSDDSFKRLNRPGGALSVSVERSQYLRAPKPVHGPELPDMKIVRYLCCGERAKVADSCNDLCICPYCGTAVSAS